LIIVLLSIDATAGAVLATVQMPALSSRHFAIGFGGSLFGSRHSLLSFKPPGFPAVQLAAAHAPTDAPLLIMFALIHSRGALGERHGAQAEQRNSNQYHANDFFHAILLKGLIEFSVRRGCLTSQPAS
jgi:hypothetical protein